MWFVFQGAIVFAICMAAINGHWFDEYTRAEAGRAMGALGFLAALCATLLVLAVRAAFRRYCQPQGCIDPEIG
jgi:hypothetical protein